MTGSLAPPAPDGASALWGSRQKVAVADRQDVMRNPRRPCY